MKLAVLALLLCAACSASAAPPKDAQVAYTVHFAPGMGEELLGTAVRSYEERFPASASFRIDARADTIRVELPVHAAFVEAKPERQLEAELRAGEKHSICTFEPLLPRGELAQVEGEWLRLAGADCERGLFGTPVAAHAAGAKVRVFEDERVRTLLASSGQFEFLQEAPDEFLAANQTTREAERARLEAWRKRYPASRLWGFDMYLRDRGGPLPDTLWRRVRSTDELVLLLRSAEARFRFGKYDIDSVGLSQDSLGHPALSFELDEERRKDFGDWTKSILGKRMAIVLDEEILMIATVKSRLPGSGIIEGGAEGFTQEEVQRLMEYLKPPGLAPMLIPVLSIEVEFLR